MSLRRRGETFVTRKITRAAHPHQAGPTGHALPRQPGRQAGLADAAAVTSPDDNVVATGEMHSVREFLQEVFSYLEMDWEKHVKVDPRYFPARRGG